VHCKPTLDTWGAEQPAGPGYCSKIGWACDNPSYDVDARPAPTLNRPGVSGHTPIPGWHDGNKITAYCWPDDEPNLIEKVDSAIEYANEEVRALRR
jgi:hypothetical protein